jgi:hypothetical protein
MTQPGRFAKQRIAGQLETVVTEANALARKLGLDPFPVNYWVVDYDEMNELIAYGGFQRRYPHWRWGMQYDRHRKRGQYGMGKAFEIVNNDDPANAFLQESNTTADQKAVITHVEAHSDFFANNEWYGMFDDGVGAAQMLERHADAIEEYMTDPSIDRDDVERWIDHALALADNIDQYRSFGADRYEFDEYDAAADVDGDVADQLDELDLSEEVREQVFDDEWLDRQGEDRPARSFPEEPEKDLLGFLRAHGKRYDDDAGKAVEMADWQRDVLEMLRAEAYYFAPQKMTKILNEGWACVAPETPVFTAEGLLPMATVVDDHTTVSDGDAPREVYDSNVIPDHDTVTVETRRGFEVTGSNNHRVRRPDGSWCGSTNWTRATRSRSPAATVSGPTTTPRSTGRPPSTPVSKTSPTRPASPSGRSCGTATSAVRSAPRRSRRRWRRPRVTEGESIEGRFGFPTRSTRRSVACSACSSATATSRRPRVTSASPPLTASAPKSSPGSSRSCSASIPAWKSRGTAGGRTATRRTWSR